MIYALCILLSVGEVTSFAPSPTIRRQVRQATTSSFSLSHLQPTVSRNLLLSGNDSNPRLLLRAILKEDTSLNLDDDDVDLDASTETETSIDAPVKEPKKNSLPSLEEYKVELEQELKERYKKRMNDKLKRQAKVKDDEIKKLLNKTEKKETQIARLKFQLVEAKSAVETTEKKRNEAINKINTLKKESDELRIKEEEELQAVKEEFSMEKDILLSDIQLMKDKLDQAQKSSSLQAEKAQEDYDKVKGKLAALEEEIQVKSDEVETAKAEAIRLQKESEMKLKKQKQQAKRFQAASTEQLKAEKRDIRNSMWDLESQLTSARYELIVSQKESASLNKTVVDLEQKILNIQKESFDDLVAMDEQMKADEMFYAQKMAASKSRMQRIVTKFQARMNRRESRSTAELANVRQSLENEIVEVSKRLEAEKREVLLAKAEELAISEAKAEADLKEAQMEYDDMVLEMNKKIDFTKKVGELDLNRLELRMNKEMKAQQEQAEQEKLDIIKASDAVLEKVKSDSHRIQTNLNQMLVQAKREKEDLRGIIRTRDESIEQYEAERASLRQLSKTAAKLAAERVVKRIKNRRFLRFKQTETSDD